jgi:hypothetical protein
MNRKTAIAGAATVLATVTFIGVMSILWMVVGKTLGDGWQTTLIPFEFTGCLALGSFLGIQWTGLRRGGET